MIKPIEGFTGYFVSDDGEVYSNLGRGNRRNGKIIPMYRIKPRALPNGYLRVYMREDATGKRKDRYIHRLVAQAFLPRENGKNFVNHKDCDRSNNHVENLEWCTSAENNLYSMKLGRLTRNNINGKFCSGL